MAIRVSDIVKSGIILAALLLFLFGSGCFNARVNVPAEYSQPAAYGMDRADQSLDVRAAKHEAIRCGIDVGIYSTSNFVAPDGARWVIFDRQSRTDTRGPNHFIVRVEDGRAVVYRASE